ncbi:4-hydroxythreonine-4-phosphate dehydrogenase [Aliidongia dinghuensis]|uniref:4-hydroxythreonine-4-phosphate dehydrogenase n=1 Tax=Aliidongia dinghuensis TaxID=1867774 RepID=A0A8J2YV19_9PROT|nr:4-hydroxythreonine-4-phosphate dehydrogenase PdxA [Aliidongia dinghuensis]GGF25222.1 4-hydroxythreonine-4-phosphate dehydrogenase [Aliidongia dinghuensis]
MPPLVLTMGEPAGIGGELAFAAWSRRAAGVPCFALLDDPERLGALARSLGLKLPIRPIEHAADAEAVWASALPVLPIPLAARVVPGKPDPANAGAIIRAIERAVALVTAGEASALVTNPIQKQVLIEAGFRHPGHTEFLADLAGPGAVPVMMLTCPGLRVVPITIHQSLQSAIADLSIDKITTVARITAAALTRDFGIARPTLAVSGLNPHAGEGGAFGREEIDVIAPAIQRLCAEGIEVEGPLPADTMFHVRARQTYDAALCMYHDQALIPIKTIDFERGVNVTLGLPFVRTSPDHGTALNLAGTGKASPESLIAALVTADQMARTRAAAR